MSEQDTCAWCGNPIPPRTDPRGRRAKYCSDACRAAATRDRNRRRHAAELEDARAQAMLPVESLDERQAAAIATLEETTAGFLSGVPVTDRTVELVKTAHQLVGVAKPPEEPQTAQAGGRPNRAQRRRAERKTRR